MTQGTVVQQTTTTTAPPGTPTSASEVTVAATPPGSLPLTGGSDNGPVFGLASLVAGAIALVFAKRRNQPRGGVARATRGGGSPRRA